MIIERPQKTDRKEIESLFQETISHTFQINQIKNLEDIEREIAVQMKTLDNHFASDDPSASYLIAKEDNVIVGTAAIGPANKDILMHLPEAADLLELKSVYVLPAYQGMRLGTRLVEAMLTELKALGQTAFVLDCGYKSAQEIWIHRFGKPTIELKNHWEGHCSYMIWQISL